ncbi:RHS repeat domain-containing protein [Streptomyces sp. NPDC054840]
MDHEFSGALIAWNAEDRLTDATTPDGDHWQYTYDALGRRTAKQRLGADGEIAERITFTWDGTRLAEQATPWMVTRPPGTMRRAPTAR